MKHPKIVVIISVAFMFLTCGCETEEDITFNKLIGEWTEVSPCSSCSTFSFDRNDTIYLEYNLVNIVLKMHYQVIAGESIEITRGYEFEQGKKTTKHKLVFYENNELEIKQFKAVDYGITGYEDVKLKKSN